ncbi:EAL domain-containing protein [Pseudazoarcus pumilus]|uniref:EAL domain-containing protein n=1 Tax=Pseudazoarcus pumilus TaxID=2067960 RepID=UPI0013DBFAE4|nr:EAL domain-containing protein [Pseudazoarcus pumilus]
MPPIPPKPARPPHEPFVADFSEGLETGLYLALLELIDEGLIITGDEVMIDANSAACRLLERDYRQIVGHPLSNLFPSERAFLAARERLLIQGEMRGSIQVVLPGGRRRDLRFIAAARLRPGMHALILSPDIVAEAYGSGLAPAEDRVWPKLAAALEQPVIVVDDAGRVQALNAPAARLPGIDGRELRGEVLEGVVAVEWPAPHEPPIARVAGLRARMLPGPRGGWRILLLPAVAGASEELPAAPEPAPQPTRPAQPTGNGIRLALEHGQFSLSLSPVVDARDGCTFGASAELIWDHPGRGLLGPRAYREEALAAGLAAELDGHLIQCALEAAALWPEQRNERCTIAIRPAAADDAACARLIEASLASSGVAPSRIDLALDATTLTRADLTVATLRRLGVGLALDRAGIDELPLDALARGGFRALRMPAELVKRLGHDEHAEGVIELLVNIAASLRAELVACGVTSAAHRDFLAAIGCPLQQGPLFGPPLTAGGFAARLRAQARQPR